jgi:trk system potassium uptake protein TrkH
VLSFALVIAVGTALLHQPWAAQPGRRLTLVESLFTATSAVCVTGLTVRPPGDHTVAGQVVILSLIQVGGLGIMTFGLFFSLLLGRRLSLFGRNLILSSLAHSPWEDFWPLLRTVMLATFAVEGVGAVFLTFAWWGEKGLGAVAWAVFHAVSAFCNAGFGLDPRSLGPWVGSPIISITVGLLIIFGGLGFLPATELLQRFRGGLRRPLSLHTRTVLSVTALLLVVGWLGFATLEWSTTLASLSLKSKVLAVWFQGITPRTAGFSTLDVGAMTPSTLMFFMALMFIGASPGSTGGGIKTTTFGVLFAVLIARVRSRRQTTSFRRGIGVATVASAIVVVLLAVATVFIGIIMVSAIEHGHAGGAVPRTRILAEAFDVVSAFGTVGLSTGITPELSPHSWVVLVLVMFIGRVGPLTLGLAFAGRPPRPEPGYAEEELMVG